MTEKKYLELLFISTSLLSLFIGLMNYYFIDENKTTFIGVIIVTIIFLTVMKIRLEFEVSKELRHIDKKYEK